MRRRFHCFFFFNDTATTEIYTLSLHDALPISRHRSEVASGLDGCSEAARHRWSDRQVQQALRELRPQEVSHHGTPADVDRKSTRLNSSHANISYAVFCLKKKKK